MWPRFRSILYSPPKSTESGRILHRKQPYEYIRGSRILLGSSDKVIDYINTITTGHDRWHFKAI